MTQNSFPTEFIELPSKGHFYPEDNPLSSGKIEMRYMTARDEDILTSANLVQQGKALDKLLESLIVDKTIDYNDLLVGDKNAVLVGARVLAYGKDYDFKYNEKETTVDLTELEDKLLDANYEMIYGQGIITNLVDLAKGDFDFAIFENIEMSDVAAGILLCKETGFIISSLNGREVSLTNNESIVIYRPNEQKIVRRIIDNYF